MGLRQNLDDFDANGKKGDWCFLNDDKLIAIQFGDDRFLGTCVLNINSESLPSWTWNRSREAPTLSPSILVHCKPVEWHGYLRDGKIETV